MLWQSAYAEFVFLDTLWPDVDRRTLWDAVEIYAQRDRRYGGAVDAAPNPWTPRSPGRSSIRRLRTGAPGDGPVAGRVPVDPPGQPGVGVCPDVGAGQEHVVQGAVDPLQGHGPAQGQRPEWRWCSRPARRRCSASPRSRPCPLALAPESSTRMGMSMPRPRATRAWPASTALSQPARTGKAMRRPVLVVQRPFALGRAADAPPVESPLGQPQHRLGPEPRQRLHHGPGGTADQGCRAFPATGCSGPAGRRLPGCRLTHRAATRPPVEWPIRVRADSGACRSGRRDDADCRC